jgi:ABC-type amino acid transport substrate-binding protein
VAHPAHPQADDLRKFRQLNEPVHGIHGPVPGTAIPLGPYLVSSIWLRFKSNGIDGFMANDPHKQRCAADGNLLYFYEYETEVLSMTKNRVIVLGLGLLAAVLLVAACGSETPTATPLPPAPTIPVLPTDTAVPVAPTVPSAIPGVGLDDSLQRVQSSGHMVVGTSADYAPFEYYNADFQFEGFDIALMDEIARRLGVTADYHDIVFEGLGGAIQARQVDLAIAAISETPERAQVMDFGNVYYISEDGVLAREDTSIAALTAPVELASWRVGVERGSVFEGWIEDTLVNTGQMPQTNLFSYEKVGDATRDLAQQRLDLVVMDLLPAEAALTGGGLKLVGQGLNQERFAIALPKGEDSLRDEVNRILIDLQNEGVLAQLAQQYLDIDPAALVPLQPASTPNPTPKAAEAAPTQVPSAEPTKAPSAQPACHDAMVFVQHLNYDDQGMSAPAQINPGANFTKSWRVQNNGTCTWTTGYQLVFAHGNVAHAKMGGSAVKVSRQVKPGETYDFNLNLVAPLKAGTYQGLWQMQNGRGQALGERLPVGVQVVARPAPTPQPTQPPAAGVDFSVDRTKIRHGECVNFSWRVDNVKEVYFYPEGNRWQNHGVVGQGSQQECPAHNQTYSLRVVKRDDSVDTRQIAISVQEPPAQAEAPTIKRFTVDPSGQVNLGQCVDIRWNVEGNIDKTTVRFDGQSLWEGAPSRGNTQHCPEGAGPASYSLEATAIGGATSRSQQNINVVASQQPVPQPTEVPEFPDPPTITGFGVSPMQITLGDCVTINWATGGGTSYVRILRNGSVVLDDAGFSGQETDCPAPAGIYAYQVEAYNPYENMVVSESRVTVSEAPPLVAIDPTEEPIDEVTVTITETIQSP